MLWQAQDQEGLEQEMEAFQAAFEQIPQAERAVKFLKNLLEAAQQVPALKAELRNGEFLDTLMQFGLTVAQLNLSEATGAEPLWSFVDTLWRGTNAGDVRLGTQQLEAFFKEATTSEQKLKLVQFSDNLIQAAKLAPSTQGQVKDPRFVDALLGLGGAYAALVPDTQQSLDEDLLPLHLVLSQIYSGGQAMRESAANNLQIYSQESGFLESMKLTSLFLKSFKDDNRYADQWKNLNWINLFVSVTRPYDTSTLIDNLDGFMLISSMERSLSVDEIKYLRDTFGNSIDYSKVTITRGNLASIGASKTLGNTIHLEDTWGGQAVFQRDGRSLTSVGLALLAHEVTHVWQWQNGGFAYAPDSLIAQLSAYLSSGDRGNAYNWRDAYSQGLAWEYWNPEQQARAMEEYNLAIQVVYRRIGGIPLKSANETIRTLTPYVLKVRQRQGAPNYNAVLEYLSPRYWPSFP